MAAQTRIDITSRLLSPPKFIQTVSHRYLIEAAGRTEMFSPQKYTLLPLVAFFILLIASMTFIDLPGDSKLVGEIQNTGHTFVFGFSALIVLRLFRHGNGTKSQNFLYQYVVVFGLCLVAGIGVELLQRVTHRDAEVSDVIRDVAGIVAFLGFYSLADTEITSRREKDKIKAKTLVAFASLMVLISALYPLARLTHVYYQRHQAFPVLVDFGSGWFSDFVTARHATLEVVAAPDDWIQEAGKSVARITLQRAKYPGIELGEPSPDWTGYSHLNFKIYSPNRDELTLAIRIHDREHNLQYSDRFNRRINIKPGENQVRITLQSIRTAPANRQMNMKEIAGMILFAAQPQKPLIFYLSNIRLD
jgi:hypothetical protein